LGPPRPRAMKLMPRPAPRSACPTLSNCQ
jgi:hypothetical protein